MLKLMFKTKYDKEKGNRICVPIKNSSSEYHLQRVFTEKYNVSTKIR